MPASLETEILKELVLIHLDADPDSLRFTSITTGRHNTSYWINANIGRFVLRIAPPDQTDLIFYEQRMIRQEPELHKLIRAKTSLPVAEVVGYDFTRKHLDRDYILLTALPGIALSDAPGLSRSEHDRALGQVGEYVRELHMLTAAECLGTEAYGYVGAHRPMEPQSTWAAAFHVMWNKLLDDVVACGCYGQKEAQLMRDLLDSYLEHFDRPVLPSLLHMDVWSQNILIDSLGNVTGLVDFDRALWGDVEIEYAVLDYCGISEPAFWSTYGTPRDESPPAMIRRQFYLLYEIQKYMPIQVWRRNNLAAATRYKKYSFELVAPLIRR